MRCPRLAMTAALLVAALLLVPGAAGAQDERSVYARAKADFKWLKSHSKAQKVYQNWLSLSDMFARVYTANPQGPLAPGALYLKGRVLAGAYDHFKRNNDFNEAVDTLRRLTNHFPRSRLADDAQYRIGELYKESGDLKQAYLEYLKVTVSFPRGDHVKAAKIRLDELERKLAPHLTSRKAAAAQPRPAASPKPSPRPRPQGDSSLAQVTDLRHWSTPTYTRVVLSLDRPVPYNSNLLRRDPKAGRPRRLYLDLRGSTLAPSLKDMVPIGDGLLARARAGQYSPDTVRLVLDIKHLASYKVFTLDNPFRVVIDCFGQTPPAKRVASSKRSSKAGPKRRVPRGKAKEAPPEVGLAQALGLKIRRVVLDPGHGGRDQGCSWRRLLEKKLTLDIALRAAPKIRKLLGCKVSLTRSSDVFVPLEARTAFANTRDADLFVSIHVNAAPSHSLSGIETYFLNLASDEESMRVAARENATTTRSISDLQVILNDLMLNSKINESNRLARAVQNSLTRTLKRRYRVRNLKVKQAPFYVLIGARMPAVLVEVGFITHREENRRLATGQYRDLLAEGLAQGLAAYARQLDISQR